MQTYPFNKQGHTSKDFKLENQCDVSCIFMQIEAQNPQYAKTNSNNLIEMKKQFNSQ